MPLLSMRQEYDPDLAQWRQMNNKMFLKLEFSAILLRLLFFIPSRYLWEAHRFVLGLAQIRWPSWTRSEFETNQGHTCVLPTGNLRCFTESLNKNELSEKELAQNSNIRNILLNNQNTAACFSKYFSLEPI